MITRRILLTILASLAIQSISFAKEKEYEKKESGMANLYYSNDDVWVEIPDSLIGKRLIFYTKVISTSNIMETNPGFYPEKQMLVRFDKADTVLTLSILNDNISAPKEDKGILLAIENSRAASIIFSSPIINMADSSGLYKSKFTDFFIGDKKYLSPKDNMAYNRLQGYVVRDYDYSSKESYVKDIAADSLSFSIISELSYDVTKKLFAITKIGSPEPFSATVISTFYTLSKSHNYTPLTLDSKMGVGSVSMLDYSSNRQGAKRIAYATRWNTAEKDSPIVSFYVDSLIPKLVYTSIVNAVEVWNNGFKEIGFTNAIELKRQVPNGDIEQSATSSIRYLRTPDKGIRSNVIVNPKDGEILSTDIYIAHNILFELRKEIIMKSAIGIKEAQSLYLPDSLLIAPLTAKITHHIGRSLGFIDNDAGTGYIPTDSLKSVTYTAQNGITNSVMDEFSLNHIASAEDIAKGVKWYQSKLGKYDLFGLKYLYGGATAVENSKIYIFGNSKSDKKYADPRALKNDLGDNPVKSARYALDNLYSSIAKLADWIDEEDVDYSYRFELLDYSVELFFQYANPVLQNIRGVNIYNNIDSESPKFAVVDRETQKESLEFLLQLTDDCTKMNHPNFMRYADLNTNVSDFIAKELFSTTLTKVLKIVENFENSLSRIDALYIISDYLWAESLSGDTISPIKKRMQIDYIKKLTKLLNSTDPDSNEIFTLFKSTKKNIEKSKKKADKNLIGHYSYLLLLTKN